MRLNGKGQVTIPAALREKFELREGDEVDFVEEDGGLKIVRTERDQRRVRRSRSSATETKGMTTEQLMGLLGG